MTLNSSTSAGQTTVPVNLESAIDMLSEVAGLLEEIACQLVAEPPIPSPSQATGTMEMHIEEALLANVTVGNDNFTAADLAGAVAAELELRGQSVAVEEIRRMLPPLMLRLFKSKLSCSLKTQEGRYARGYRGLAAR